MNNSLVDRADIRLLVSLWKMQLQDRYIGSALGCVWSIVQPLFLLATYTFIFGYIFKTKLPGTDSSLSYAIWMISGLVPCLAVNEAITAGANSVVAGANMIKNVIFKSEILPVAATLTALIPLTVGMVFLLLLLCLDGNYPSWHALLLLPIIGIQFALLSGIGLILGSVAVFLRDIVHTLPTLLMFWLFLTPVFYPVESLSPLLRQAMFVNPLYHLANFYRDVLVNHAVSDLWGITYCAVLALVLNVAGLALFRRLKMYFEMAL